MPSEILSATPSDLQTAQSHYAAGRWAQSKAAFEAIIPEYPGEIAAYWGVAESAIRLGAFDESLAHYNQVIRYATAPIEVLAAYVAKGSILSAHLSPENGENIAQARSHFENTQGYLHHPIPAMRLVQLQLGPERALRYPDQKEDGVEKGWVDHILGAPKALFSIFFAPSSEDWVLNAEELGSFKRPPPGDLYAGWLLLQGALYALAGNEDAADLYYAKARDAAADLLRPHLEGAGELEVAVQNLIQLMDRPAWRALEHHCLLGEKRLPALDPGIESP